VWLFISFISALFLVAILWLTWPDVFTISDGIAQFMPVSVHASRVLFSGDLPLFNFFQFLGHPVLAVGYYPVLYPLLWFAYGISRVVLLDIQQTWNVLCSLQLIFNAVASYFLFSRTFRVRPIFASIGALSITFSGIALYEAGEWFYCLVVYGFLAILLCLSREIIDHAKYRTGVFLGVAAALFLFASNVNYIFYAAHVVLFACIAWFGSPSAIGRRLRILKVFAVSALIAGLLAGPYFLEVAKHSRGTLREIGPVSLDKYYWVFYDWKLALRYSALPAVSILEPAQNESKTGARPPAASYYFGLVPALGLFLVPLAWRRSRYARADTRSTLLWLMVGLLFTAGMSLGPDGIIAGWFYHVPPYNWFRHSIKWGTFFQFTAICLGIVSLEGVVPRKRISAVELPAWAVTVSLLLLFIWAFPQVPRLTGDKLPIPKPTIGFDKTHRHLGIWVNGDQYTTDMPMRLLGHNYPTLWEIPGTIGYDPQVLKRNCDAAFGQFFPGFLTLLESVDLSRALDWGVRLVRMPTGSTGNVLGQILKKHPTVQVKALGTDTSLGVEVFELPDARDLVFGENLILRDVQIGGNSVKAHIEGRKHSRFTFNWLSNPEFEVRINGKKVAWEEDYLGRPVAALRKSGRHIVELIYRPLHFLRMFYTCSFAALLLAISIWIAERKKPIVV
jgi:hypothetical protein